MTSCLCQKWLLFQKKWYKQLFDKEEMPIGQYIKINNINYKVVGVYEPSNTVNFDRDTAYIPFTTFKKVYNSSDKIDWMMITANEWSQILNKWKKTYS